MKERPILFSKPMVCAIREGRKTQTRRAMKPQPVKKGSFWEWAGAGWSMDVGPIYPVPGHSLSVRCPYGQPGDRLWVRESWRIGAWDENEGALCIDYRDGPRKEWVALPDGEEFERYWIQCSEELDDKGIKTDADGNYKWEPGQSPLRWRPSIHMPRWASRILLEIVSVRVERLNQISREDAIAEGITSRPNCFGFNGQHDGWSADWSRVGLPSKFATQDNTLCESDISLSSPQLAFQNLWETINGHDSWDANPWVWVVEFKVVHS